MTARTLLLRSVDFETSTRSRDLSLIVMASFCLALSAQVRVHLPFTPVPVTGQTFAVGLVGLLLGARRGGMAVLLYLLEGAAGLPFFAGASGGTAVFIGPTAGYLLAMPFGAAVAGAMAERGWDRNAAGAFLAMLVCSLLILLTGTAWLALLLHDLPKAALLGFAPFLVGELFKAALAAGLLPSLWSARSHAGRP